RQDGGFGNEGGTVRTLRLQLNGIWDAILSAVLLGKFYNYLLDEKDPARAREVLDPYAINSVASSTRGRVSTLTTPVSRGPKLESPTDAIIYEIHVRDLTVARSSGAKEPGLYSGFVEHGTHVLNDESF